MNQPIKSTDLEMVKACYEELPISSGVSKQIMDVDMLNQSSSQTSSIVANGSDNNF